MSHIDHWTELQHNGKVCCDAECEEPRRDRVVFDVRKQQFVVYADRCILMRPDVIQQIVAEKALSSDVTAATDAPYRCITSECWKTAGHGGKENKNTKFKSKNNRNSNGGGQKKIRRQQTTTQQIIAENVKHLIEQLEQGKSEALTAYLGAMARFHNYSFGNILSIANQRAVT